MPRTPRNKENKEPVIIEDVKEPEPEPEVETEQAPGPEQDDETVELEIPKKRPRQRTEKQLEQLKHAREKALLNKEAKTKTKRGRRTKD